MTPLPLNCLLLFPSYVKYQAKKSLQEILSREMFAPQVFGRKKNVDVAWQWGLEMEYWHSQGHYNIAIAMGEKAVQLKLEHHLIAHYLKVSALALRRSNILMLLKGVQKSPNHSRSEYEKAILDAWSFDPGFGEYLELLRKVIAFRIRKKNPDMALLKSFEQEYIEFELNKKLAAFILGS